jgi:hypothetical protein
MPEQDTPTEAAAESTGDSTEATATEATTTETQATEVDWQARFEGQQKVNRDLERKFKEAAAARDRVAELEAQVAKFEGRESEYVAAQEAQRIKDDALAKANERIVAAELRAAAKGKVADDVLSDLTLFIKPSDFEVGEDGDVDAAAIAAAVTDLINSKPSLAAQGSRFQGSADGGARNDATKVAQLTRSDMERMTPEQIVDARAKGQFADLLSGSQ